MTGAAPGTSAGRTPHTTPERPSEVTGETLVTADGATVQVAYLHSSRVSHSWHLSMMNLLAYDKSVGSNVIRAMPYAVQCSGPNSLPEGRNLAVKQFLDETDHEWLFFVDTDMGFRPESLEMLLVAADKVQRPVMGGLCFAMKHMGSDGKGGFVVRPVPTLFSWGLHAKQGLGFASRLRYPPETVTQVAGTGAAFLLIHRSTLELVRGQFGDTWFDLRTYDDGTSVSEDLSFCWRVAEVGDKIFVHTGVKVTHHKEVWLGEEAYQMPDVEPMAEAIEGARKLAEQVKEQQNVR